MSVARNAPCPCGSGRKLKRCCEQRRRDRAADRRRDERVGQAAEEWAFERFGDQLVAAAAPLLERLADSADATWIAQHWAMLDFELPGGGTAAGRYAALANLSAADRDVATRIADSRVGVHRITGCRPGDGLDLEDARDGARVTVTSHRISCDARAGGVLVGRVMQGPVATLWGPARVFPAVRASALLDDVARIAAKGRELRMAWPDLMVWTAPPVFAQAAWDADDPDAVIELLPDCLEYEDDDDDGAAVYGWHLDEGTADYGGYFSVYSDGFIFNSYDEELLDRAIALVARSVGASARLAERKVIPLGARQPRSLAA